jgi:hypothetical protein
MGVPMGNTDYCAAHPEACPQPAFGELSPLFLYGNLSLLFAFDFRSGNSQ